MSFKKNIFSAVSILCALAVGVVSNAHAGDLETSFGGYVKLDATQSTNGGSGIHDATGLYNVDLLLLSEDSDSRFDSSAKQTTLNATIKRDVDGVGEIKAYIEGNFYGEGSFGRFAESSGVGSFDFIMRHAYLEVGDFTLGQTWSTFTDLNGLVELADFGLGNGQVWARTAQVRYTKKVGDSFKFMLSAENPALDVGGGDIDGQSRPDFVARVDFDGDWGHLSVAGIARAIESDRSPLNGSEVDDSQTGSGFQVTTKIPLGDNFSIVGQYAKGDLGFHVGLTGFADAAVISPTELDPLEIDALSLGLTAKWTDKVRSNALYSTASVTDGTILNPAGIDDTESFHINTWYQYTENVSFGVEFQHSEATTNTGANPDVDRFGFHAIFSF